MTGEMLFGDLGGSDVSKKPRAVEGAARVRRPDRTQSVLRPEFVDQLIPHDHRARAIVAAVEFLDLSMFYESIRSRGSDPGRPATDPSMLVSLWLFAISEGVGSGRQLARLCERDDAYRWICGGVPVNYHTLTDFRVLHGRALDDLLSQVLAAMMQQGMLRLRRIAQDGVRVRASAGAGSFRRERSLKKCLAAAKEQVKHAKAMLDKGDPTRPDKQRAAIARAAKSRQQRVEAAIEVVKSLQATKKTDEQVTGTRASTTDPDARVMRMGDGGYRPAFNLQFASDVASGAVVGVGMTNSGSDAGLITPMLDEVERRTGKKPKEWLADGGYVELADIQKAGEAGVKVLAPVPEPKSEGTDPHTRKKGDTEHVAAWRRRMGTEQAKQTYRQRAATAERLNADLRAHRGLKQFPVRGMDKALSIGLWMALTFNILTWIGPPPIA